MDSLIKWMCDFYGVIVRSGILLLKVFLKYNM